MLLVFEINGLRRELKLTRDKLASYEAIIGVSGSSKPSEAGELRLKLADAVTAREELDLDHNEELEVRP